MWYERVLQAVTPEYLKWRDDVRLLIDKQRREALLYYRKSKGA